MLKWEFSKFSITHFSVLQDLVVFYDENLEILWFSAN